MDSGSSPVTSPKTAESSSPPKTEKRNRILGREHTGLSQGNPDPEKLCTLRRLRRRNTPSLAKGVKNPETVLALSRRNYKVYADLVLSPSKLVRQLTILDTGAGSNFVRVDTLPPGWEALVIPGEIPTIADANERPLRTSG